MVEEYTKAVVGKTGKMHHRNIGIKTCCLPYANILLSEGFLNI